MEHLKGFNSFLEEYKGPTYIHDKIKDLSVDYDQRREDLVNTIQKTFQLIHKDKFLSAFSNKEKKKYKRIGVGYRRYLGYLPNTSDKVDAQIAFSNQIREMLEYDGPSWGHLTSNKYFHNREIVDEINTWKICAKSPWSHSYYDTTELDFGYKPEGSKRIADHWNFTTKKSDRIECQTHEEVPDDNKYRLGIFENGKYRIVKNFE